jgi:hypothetical protein
MSAGEGDYLDGRNAIEKQHFSTQNHCNIGSRRDLDEEVLFFKAPPKSADKLNNKTYKSARPV